MKKNKENIKILMVISALMLVAFGVMAYLVWAANGGRPLPMDLAIQEAIVSLRSDGLNVVLKGITYLSNPQFIVVLIVVLLLLPKTRKKIGLPIGLTELGAFATYSVIKRVVMRPRPDAALHLVSQGGFSFPSGHAVTSMVVYGLAIYLIGRYCKNKKLTAVLRTFFGVLIIAIGLSRVYVGVHWPTDIIAGWCLGIGFLTGAIAILEKRKKNENL